MKKIYLESYGCASSQSDAQIIRGILSGRFEFVKKPEQSDLIILNTCTVKGPTENKMVKRIKQITAEFPDKKLIVSGCMPEAEPSLLRKIAPAASLVSTNLVSKIGDAVSKSISGQRVEFLGKAKDVKSCMPKVRANPVIGISEICSGCLNACSYCITKLAKGHLLSYPPEKIVHEISGFVKSGCKEIWITGQDVGAYSYTPDLPRSTRALMPTAQVLPDGRSDACRSADQKYKSTYANCASAQSWTCKSGITLPKLLKKTVSIKGEFFLRLGMMNPSSILPVLPELIESYKNPKVFKFLHLPVQSGSDKVLKAMNRGYRAADFKKIVSAFRKSIPGITIWTDIIVGFPGETEQDFTNTLKLVEEIKPDFVNISKFGARPGTKAAELKDLPKETKETRSRKLSEMVSNICLEKNKWWVGWSGPVLVDEWNEKNKNWIGRNPSYKPVVLKGKFKPGQIVDVKIISAEKTHLAAREI